MPASDPQCVTDAARRTDGAPPPSRRPFQFRLRTIFLVTTVLCLFLAVPAVAWLLGYVAAYIAVSFAGVGVLIAIQAVFFLLFDALGWLPPRRERRGKRRPPLE